MLTITEGPIKVSCNLCTGTEWLKSSFIREIFSDTINVYNTKLLPDLKWDIIKITVYMYEFIKEQINNNKALL